jgi:cytoskeletal protein CcmA (bactofilin family)
MKGIIMTKKNSKSLLEAVETLIGENALFEGNLSTDKPVRIDGKFKGNIVKAFGVIIGEKAFIEGDISAQAVEVNGTVKGNIMASEYIEFSTTAKVHGDIKTNILSIAEGAQFEGNSSMLPQVAETGSGAVKK